MMLYVLFVLYEINNYRLLYEQSLIVLRLCNIVFHICHFYWNNISVNVPFDGNYRYLYIY